LLADPLLLNSTFTHLFFLEGRFMNYYKKFDDRQSVTGNRVMIWKVDWEGFEKGTVAGAQVGASTTVFITPKREA